MSLILPDKYSNATPVSLSYPQGSFKNESVSGLLDGTPFEKEWPNDIFGFLQSFVEEAQITPSGVADTVLASDYYDGFKHVIAQGYSNIKNYDPFGLTGQALAIGSDGKVYRAKIANGPSSSVVDPVGDLTGTWITSKLVTIEFLTSGTYTKPAGLKTIIVRGVGGGAGSSGTPITGAGFYAIGTPGAAGGYSEKIIQADDLLASEIVTIGAGGAAGAANGNGGAGGTTSFGSHITCAGAPFTVPNLAAATYQINLEKQGGSSSGGDINIIGGNSKQTAIIASSIAVLGGGGDSAFGVGGGANYNGVGFPGTGYGTGGGPSSSGPGQAARIGAPGMQGAIYITEIY